MSRDPDNAEIHTEERAHEGWPLVFLGVILAIAFILGWVIFGDYISSVLSQIVALMH